jgi:excisionase family DNA binding protein|tara:strand:- start:5332 stop:5490 length:159 start_codon:yes stop_codon:yes gene_type:complete
MTIKDVAEYFGVSTRTVHRWKDAKLFKYQQLTKGTIRVKPDEVKKFEQRRTK